MHGSSPSVGVIGYLLGGGLSFYGRTHGLAVNHVRAFEVVTPDGALRRVDAENGAELFWALRGGGGAYAVVTAVELGLLPYAEVTGGALFFRAEQAGRVLRDVARVDEDGAGHGRRRRSACCACRPSPRSPSRCAASRPSASTAWRSTRRRAARLEQLLRSVADPIMGGFGPMPSAAVARLHGDPEEPVPAIGDAILLEKLDAWAIEAFLRVAGEGSPLLAAELRHLGGALAAPPAGAGRPRAPRGQVPHVRRRHPGRAGAGRRARRVPRPLPRRDGALGDGDALHELRRAPRARWRRACPTRRSRAWPGSAPRSTPTSCSSPRTPRAPSPGAPRGRTARSGSPGRAAARP